MSNKKTSGIRNRVKELRMVPASELLANPKNWRRHPSSQRTALAAMLDKIGYADALIARETPEGLLLIDGHLRRDLTPDAEVPVLVVDLSEAESDLLLATLDPLAAMARTDEEELERLLQDIKNVGNEALIEDIYKIQDEFMRKFNSYNDDNCIYPIVPKPGERHELFVIISDNETDSNWLREKLGMQEMKSYKRNVISQSNVISVKDLMDKL